MTQEVAARRHTLLGISLDPLTMAGALGRCARAIEYRDYLSIGMVNAAKVVAMRRDDRLRDAVTGCEMVLADGQSLVWASQLLGSPLPERVAGIDLFSRLLGLASAAGYRAYFLGARPDVLERMVSRVAREYPGVTVAGARDGYFRAEDEPRIAAGIRDCGPDLLFLGMSSPKKELFMRRWGARTGAAVVHGVGGSFDVLAGVTRRAPAWYQEHGLEWLYRAQQEPLRLGRRYLQTNAAFMAMVAYEMVRGGLGEGSGAVRK